MSPEEVIKKRLETYENEKTCREVFEENELLPKKCMVCGVLFVGLMDVCGMQCNYAIQGKAKAHAVSSPNRIPYSPIPRKTLFRNEDE